MTRKLAHLDGSDLPAAAIPGPAWLCRALKVEERAKLKHLLEGERPGQKGATVVQHCGHRSDSAQCAQQIGDETMDRREDIGHHDSLVGGDRAHSTTITSLVADLASQDGLVRADARRSLVAIGQPAVAPLIEALKDADRQVRWEAGKALGQIPDPAAAPALVEALRDSEFSVRWLAAEGLVALGRKGLEPLLRALVEHSDSAWLRQGAHHVLHGLARGSLKELVEPVLAALDDVEPSLEAPLAAESALGALTETSRAGRETR